MFLQELDDRQKECFLRLAYRVAAADGEDSREEEHVMQQLRSEMAFQQPVDMGRAMARQPDVSAFDSHRARVIAALELLLLAYADEYVHEAEIQAVRDICFAMEFNEEWLAVMGEWATRLHDVAAEDPEDDERQAYRDALMDHAEAMMTAA